MSRLKRMKHKMALLGLVVVTALTTTGCGILATDMPQAPVMAPPGFLFEDTVVPLTLEKKEVVNADNTPLESGSSKAKFFGYSIFRFGWGDDSLEDAILDGKLEEVHYADVRHFNVLGFNVLGLYREQEVIAYGPRKPFIRNN